MKFIAFFLFFVISAFNYCFAQIIFMHDSDSLAREIIFKEDRGIYIRHIGIETYHIASVLILFEKPKYTLRSSYVRLVVLDSAYYPLVKSFKDEIVSALQNKKCDCSYISGYGSFEVTIKNGLHNETVILSCKECSSVLFNSFIKSNYGNNSVICKEFKRLLYAVE